MHSVKLIKEHLENAYIIPCDIWCDRNPFHRHELYSWYMVSDLVDNDSTVRVNRKMELVTVPESSGVNAIIGICYLVKEDAGIVAKRIEELCKNQRYDGAFWEEALYNKDRMIVAARVVHSADVVEINTYEQLREIDSDSNQLKTDAIQVICEALDARPEAVTDITVLKKGMTNRSFLFTCKGKKYIMRIPGEGTDQLINRRQEAAVYQAIDGKHICDDGIHEIFFPAEIAAVTPPIHFFRRGLSVLQEDKPVLCLRLPQQAPDKAVGFAKVPYQIKVRTIGSTFRRTLPAEILEGQAVAFDSVFLNRSVWPGRIIRPNRRSH